MNLLNKMFVLFGVLQCSPLYSTSQSFLLETGSWDTSASVLGGGGVVKNFVFTSGGGGGGANRKDPNVVRQTLR